MRRGAHEGEEIVRRMELALPCGLRFVEIPQPTVAVVVQSSYYNLIYNVGFWAVQPLRP